jgi:endogenous inhibitor of DNA gyrase (YacG/DUF329 family)
MSDERVIPFPERRPAGQARCPICGKPATAARRPFCSRRCAEVDLGRWLKEGYRIPGETAPEGGRGEDGDTGGDDESDQA